MAMCCALRSNLTVAEMANYRSGVKLLPEPHAVYNIFATSVVLTMFISSAERRKVDETAESCAGGRMNSLLKSLLSFPHLFPASFFKTEAPGMLGSVAVKPMPAVKKMTDSVPMYV